ncbi:K02A2.6-like [Cordylochernes scorpioides]|uniref:RNA-directed DNA polymerase n=1 Tax=Cordylochernes scorpioides TaxID=51811 RepID=A0ABY6KD55_9ARAC|nr:K02A2.6-like [Cordylochernes scorpioides]
MLDNDIIEPSYSPFSSPVTLVTKRDKTKRFCIDYRKVNEVISSDVHPLPRIEDILDHLARAKYFSTADVSSAYWQVPIHPDSRPLLAFATIDGLYQPTRLPFGLKTSPQIYERAINQVLQGHGLDCVAHYFDDFVIYSETLEEHQEHLRRFFAFCDAENLQLNLTKCEFFRQTIEFLGYTITAGTTTPLIRNTDVIHAIPPPNNRKTLQSFLGAVNVYNKFIPDYARLRTPLNNLLKKDVTWDWDDKCQKAFTSLKESLTQHPVLHLYKDELPCQVYCDASTLGIAGVLKQVHSAGKAYPVQYFSRALRVHERNYTISELECLAIVESVEKFRVYLMGRKFTIFSDHHALQWLKTIKNPSGRLFRWSLRLSCYEYEVRYIKGSLQHEADLLSRNPFCGFLDATIIKNHQLTPSGESKLTIDRNGLQTLKRRGVTKIVVPDALVPDLLTKVHSRYNHPGISQMTRLISPQYYWKGMSEDISKTTKACAICQSTKHPRGPTFGELGQLPVATQPFDLVALDTIAGLAKYGNAKAYLHVVVDHFSRYTWTFPSKSTSITTYQQVIKRVLQDGSPKRLLTDRAPAFTSPKFRKFLINRNIHPLLTTSNNPQANGLCERLNATLTGKLRLLHLGNPKAAWTKLAKRVTVVYNNTPHSVTGFPPGYLMFGVLPPELTEHVNPYPVLTTARRIAHERTQAKHLKDKHAYDQQHKTPHFEPGDLVLVKVYHHPNTGKLAPYFTGPYEILEIISPNVVRINRPNQPLNRNTDTVHVNKLQYYNENIRYIAPPTLIPHPAKPQSRTLPPLFEHLTPDLFTRQGPIKGQAGSHMTLPGGGATRVRLSGCYEYLEGGNLTDALVDFTGGISQSIFVRKYVPQNYPALFRNLQRYMEKHALMCCAIDNENAEREEVYHNGLVNGHAYSIIDFRRVPINQPGTSSKINLIRLRNPWGGQEWNGAFSNKMPFLEFCRNFTDISICHMPNSTWYSYETMWYEASIRGRWTSGTEHSKYDRSGGCVNNKRTFLQNPQYCLDISSNNEEIIIYLMQRDLRLDTKVKAPYIAIGMFITQVEENRVYRLHKLIRRPYSSEYIKTRGVFMKCLINKGRYLLIPTTFEPGQLQEFFLRVYSNKDVNLRELMYDHPKKNRWNVFALNQEVVITSFTLLSVANLNPAFLDHTYQNGLRIFCLVKCEKFKFFTTPIPYSDMMVWDVSYIMYHQYLESPIIISVWEQKIGDKDSALGHTQIRLDQSSSNTLVYTKAILEYNGEKKIGTLKIEVRRSNNLFEL